MTDVMVLEPFYGGSHKQLLDVLCKELNITQVFTLEAKKWHWRARTSALQFYKILPNLQNIRVLFCSSVLNLAELVALRPELLQLKKIVYFHENQLVYPVRKAQDRDFQYGYNQITTCLVADCILFNSQYNMESFLSSINSFLKLMPDKPSGIVEKIEPKCQVLYFPIQFPLMSGEQCNDDPSNTSLVDSASKCVADHDEKSLSVQQSVAEVPLHIVWPHRWEHDKDPETFFQVLFKLLDEGFSFNVSILGDSYSDIPDIFQKAKVKLESCILNWGYAESKAAYYKILQESDVVVSTAKHEFFGVAMLEAVHLGCYPLCPNRLVYPEIYPDECLYKTEGQLLKKLRYFCKKPETVRHYKQKVDAKRFSWENLHESFRDILLK